MRLYQAAKGNEKGIASWIAAIQSDFATLRAKWCVTDKYEDANHLPEVSVAEGIDLTATVGEEITLNGTAEDPGLGDTATFRWYHYPLGRYLSSEAEDEAGNPVAIEVTTSGENRGNSNIYSSRRCKIGATPSISLWKASTVAEPIRWLIRG
ncbi:MAG: hypothetical protein ACLU6Y_00425 [Ruminococcus sp.]